MATLFNTKIKDTYQSLLKLEDNTILTTTVKNVTDGLGNASPLYMSTTQVRIGSTSGSAMYWDNVNNRLGIGTSSPTQALSVNGTITANGLSLSGALQGTGTGDNYLKGSAFTIQSAVNNTDNSFYISTASLLERKVLFLAKNLGSYGRSDLYLCINGDSTATNASITDSKVLFKANGNVLIGTTTDAGYKLDVNGSARVKADSLTISASGLTSVPAGYVALNFDNAPNHHQNWFAIRSIKDISGVGIGYDRIICPTMGSNNSTWDFNALGTYSAISISSASSGNNLNLNNTSITFNTNFKVVTMDTANRKLVFGNMSTDAHHIGVYDLVIKGAQPYEGNTGGSVANGGNVYVVGGTPSTSPAGNYGNVILAHDGTSARGNVLIGTTTDSGYKLDVNGTLRSGIIYLTSNNGKIQYATDIYMQFPAQGGPVRGVFADGGYGWDFISTQTYSTLRPGNGTTTPSTWSLSQSVKSFGRNTFYITTDLTNASGASSVGETITLLNVNLNGPTAAYAYKPSLKLKAGNSGTHSGADQYARSGDLYLESGDANSGTATDVAGGTTYLSSGRGTGAGTPGNLILSTAIATTTGTALQTLVERMRINGSGNVMINTSTDNGYKLNVNGTAFVSELITTGGIVKHNPYTAGGKALEIYSGTGHLGNTGVWASMYSTGVYGNGWDPYFGTQGIGVAGDPNNNSNGGSVVNIGVYGGAALSNATGVYGTSGLFGKAANLRNASAALEVNSTTHGFLPPRMTAAQRSALTTIAGFGVITGGSGYVDGTYYTVSITGGSGQNAYARIVISGGSVTSVTLETNLGGLTGGFGYTNGASVSASNTQLGGTGAGFSVIINASTPIGMMVYQTDTVEGLYIYKSTGWTFIA